MKCKCGKKYSSLTVNCLCCNEQTPWASDYARLCRAEPMIGLQFTDSDGVKNVSVQLVENGRAIGFVDYEDDAPVRVGFLKENTSEQVVALCDAFLSREPRSPDYLALLAEPYRLFPERAHS